jgi:hypothetical protein
MGNGATKATRDNRTITVDFHDESPYCQLMHDGKAFVECVLAFVLSLGFQLAHKATCTGGGCLTRHSHDARVRLGGVTIWRLQCTTCRAVFTVLPHFVLRYRQMRPDVARDALWATHGGLSLELCAMLYHLSPMALYRLVCAFGHHSLVTVLTRCGLPLPVYVLADEKHTHCLTTKAYLVWPKYSCGLAVVVFQEPTEPLSALDRPFTITGRLPGTKRNHIAESLMTTFLVVMLDVLAQHMTQ